MSVSKEKIIETIETMPQEALEDIGEVFEEPVLSEKIERGLQDVKEGKVVSHEEAKRIMHSWLK